MLPGFISSALLLLFAAFSLWFTVWAEKKVTGEVVEELVLLPTEETPSPVPGPAAD